MADDYWKLSEDGNININFLTKKIVYHPTLNVLLAISRSQISVIDVYSGSLLQRNSLSGDEDGFLQCDYLPSHDKLLITDNYSIGVRGSYNGIIFFNNFLQRPVSDSHRTIKIELLVSEAKLLQKALSSMEIAGDHDQVMEVLNALSSKLEENQSDLHTGVKAQKWSTVTISLPLYVIKVICVGIINELKRLSKNVPVLTIASIIQDQVNNYLPSDNYVVDRLEMFSEAARRKTFEKWPHMNYKWALPDEMAQAGFYHQPHNKGDDRAMCFTCIVCLVCWEPADEPWSEHERHAPSCPFIKGEYTQNVPLSVTLATAPALPLPLNGVPIEVGTSSAPGLISTVSDVTGFVFVWNYLRLFKMEARIETESLRDAAFLEIVGSLHSDRPVPTLVEVTQDQLVDLMMYMNPTTKVTVGASCVIGKPQRACIVVPERKQEDCNDSDETCKEIIRPSLLTGVKAFPRSLPIVNGTEMVSNRSSLTTEALAKAVETLSRSGSELDLLLMFKEEKMKYQRTQLYIVIYDFHYHDPELSHKSSMQNDSSKKTVSGTGTSASRLDNSTSQDIFSSKNLCQKLYELVGNEGDISCTETLVDSVAFTTSVVNNHSINHSITGLYNLPLGIVPTTGGGTLSMSGAGLSFPSTSNSTSNYNKAFRDPKIDGECLSKNSENTLNSKRPKITYAQCFPILSDEDTDNLIIKKFIPTLDGSHVLAIVAPKNYYPDRATSANMTQGGFLLLFEVVVGSSVVKLKEQPVKVRQFNVPSSSPVEVYLLPSLDKEESVMSCRHRPLGVGVILTFDGSLELFDVATLNTLDKIIPKDYVKFVSITYCNSKERLCATTADGTIYFYSLFKNESRSDASSLFSQSLSETSSTSSSSTTFLADLPKLSMPEIKLLHELTRFEILTPCFSATVPPCWTELMHAVKQRRLPQLLRNSDINQYSRGWRLQNDLKTSWNDHIFEITLSRSASIGYIDVKFSLHYPCLNLPRIQFTLLKQRSSYPPKPQPPNPAVDSFIDFNMAFSSRKSKWKQFSDSGPSENPVLSEDFLTMHNAEILCGPIDIADCLNLSEQGGSVRFTSPEFLHLKGRTLLIHIKALPDDSDSSAPKKNGSEHNFIFSNEKKILNKVDTFCWKIKQLEVPAKPGQTVERVASSKIVQNFVGVDWLHEVCVTISKTKTTSIPNEKAERIQMAESSNLVERLLEVVFSRKIVMQSMALDILIWIACIRLGGKKPPTKSQKEFVQIIETNLHSLVQHCFILAGRSIAHKCVKLLVICSEAMKNCEDETSRFDSYLLDALLEWLPSIPQCWSAGSLHWFFTLLSQVVILDNNATAVKKCVALLKQIGTQLNSRQNVYHCLLRTRFGLYSSPFEPELFDLEPPAPARFLSVPVSYASVVNNEPDATTSNAPPQTPLPSYSASEPIDLRELLDLPRASVDGKISVSSNRLRGLTANHFMKGLLEVEPLHFSCFSASDGTKLEKVDSGNLNIATTVSCLLDTWTSSTADNLAEENSESEASAIGDNEKCWSFPWQQILTTPSQHMIVIERMHSGARRFVVLDLGATILLTDLLIPSCSELFSLSVDIWIKGEDVDGQRLILTTDIASKTLIMSDIQPPPVCRYLKITTIGRYGMSTAKCKIPIGSFYGHVVVLPDENYAEGNSNDVSTISEYEIDDQLNILNAILENIQCRYALSCSKLKEYLNPLILTEIPNVLHMHQYFNKIKNEKVGNQDSQKILISYKECVSFQYQLNIVRSIIHRLQSLNSVPSESTPTDTKAILENACIDKLRVLGECVLDLLLYVVYEIGPVSRVPQSFYNSLDQGTCENLFYQFCVSENTRVQISMCTFLLRACCYQSWWGKFLVTVFTNLYSSKQTIIFPQDRLFVLLTYLGQKSIAAGTSSTHSNVIETLLMQLLSLLAPIATLEPTPGFLQANMDLSLITWLLLFLIQCLDSSNFNNANSKTPKEGGSSRWDFIQGDHTLQRKLSTADNFNPVRNCRRKLHKKLMQHKQQFGDLEVAKEAFQASTQAASALCNQASKLKMELKTVKEKVQEQFLKKQLRGASQAAKASPATSSAASFGDFQLNVASSSNSFKKPDADSHSFSLPVSRCLPVARALIKFLLFMDLTCNIDLFLLTCNVLARVVEVARSRVCLGQLVNQATLLRLMKIAVNVGQYRPWAAHAITCLLQDLILGDFKNSHCKKPFAENQSTESPRPENVDEDLPENPDAADTAGASNKSSAELVLPPLSSIESDDSDFEDFMENLKEPIKKLSKVTSPITVTSSSISTAMDSRLEFYIDSNTEITLQRMTVQNAYNLPISVHASLSVSEDVNKAANGVYWDESLAVPWQAPVHPTSVVPSSVKMLSACFDHLISQTNPQPAGNLELILQLWLTLSTDSSDCNTSLISLSPTAISSLITQLSWHPSINLRVWCLAFQAITLATNLQSSSVTTPACSKKAESMTRVIINNPNLLMMFHSFLSSSYFSMVGTSICLSLQKLIIRLEMRGDANSPDSQLGIALKNMMLRLVLLLVTPVTGAIPARRGPLDAQNSFIHLVMYIEFSKADLTTAMSIVEAVGALLYSYVPSTKMIQHNSSESTSNSMSTQFGALINHIINLESGELKQNKIPTYENLLINLLKLSINLVITRLKGNNPTTNPANESVNETNSQTDEHKAAEQQTQHSPSQPSQSSQSESNKVPCLADVVIQHESTMLYLMQALSGCGGAPFSLMQLSPYLDPIISLLDNSEPFSVADALFQLVTTLVQAASSPTSVLKHIISYLSGETHDPSVCLYRLSEPLLWFFLRALKSVESVKDFEEMGGIRLICSHLVASCSYLINARPSTVALVMQNLTHPPVINSNTPSKKLALSALETDNLLNFAPLGTISCSNSSAAHTPDILIQVNPPHRRARTPAWSYHFYPDEVAVDLILTLPCAVLIHEVHLQPHLTSLAMCPSSVGIELGTSKTGWFIPVSVPLETSGRIFIRLALPQPEVATAVLLRLYRPKESANIGLTQIKLLGTTPTTTFSSNKCNLNKCEDDVTKSSSVGWLCLLNHCCQVSSSNNDVSAKVISAIANSPGIVEACCSLFLTPTASPAPPLYTTYIQNILLSLGLHSRELGLLEVSTLLHNGLAVFLQGGFSSDSQCFSSVELLFMLCTKRDQFILERVRTLVTWLLNTAYSNQDGAQSLYPYVYCVAAVLWANKDFLSTESHLDESESNSVITFQLFSSLCNWGQKSPLQSALKRAIDSVLCSICYIHPDLFIAFLNHVGLLPNLSLLKINKGWETDDRKEWLAGQGAPKHVTLSISETDLLTLATLSRSSVIVSELINSGFPSVLVNNIIEFCSTKNWQSTESKSMYSSSSSESPLTDNDKAHSKKRIISLIPGEKGPVRIETVSLILQFFSELCSEGITRDWLGSREGAIFWEPLLNLLCNSSNDVNKLVLMNGSWSNLEDQAVKFFSRCCWGHLRNQEIFSHVLCSVISAQNSQNSSIKYLHGLSGFTRRLILQLLLESDKVFVSVNISSALRQTCMSTVCSPYHPSKGIDRCHQLLYLSTQTTMMDIINMVSTPGSLDCIISELNKVRDNSNSEMSWWEAFSQLSIASAVTAKDKRSKEAKNIATALCDPRGKSKTTPLTELSMPLFGKPHAVVEHSALTGPIAPNTTVSQVMATLSLQGLSLSTPIIELNVLESPTFGQKDVSVDVGAEGLPSPLQMFSQIGGLALLAQHLPLVYPESQQPSSSNTATSTSPPPQLESEWVKVDATDDIYMEIDYACNSGPTTSSKLVENIPVIPAHSLAAFGLFLRLPGYSDVLLRSKKNAQCLLRLVLGVTDDGEGGDILTSSLSSFLPTLPFEVLDELLSSTPLTTDDGVVIRRAAIDLGAVHLILACLAALTHHPQHISLPGIHQQLLNAATRAANEVSANARGDKQLLYWAKGTGFGTGSTAQSWNIEKALLRQKCEESHITVLIQVLSSFINPKAGELKCGIVVNEENGIGPNVSAEESSEAPLPNLPTLFYQLLEQSCLLPAISSYLRNDSVLDMARHIPLYRAILRLLRVIVLNDQCMEFLFPRATGNDEPSICSLLLKMKNCVDNYSANLRDKINKSKNSRKSTRSSYMKIPTPVLDEMMDQDEEGLASLIPDIQGTAKLVQAAMEKITCTDSVTDVSTSNPPTVCNPEAPLQKTVEERYLEFMKALQFDMYEMIVENNEGNGIQFAVSHHFETVIRSHGDRSQPSRVKRLAQEAVTLSTSLPLSYSSSVFVRCDADRLDVMKVLITGPAETPYMNGCFEFDVYFPKDYPNSPMLINLETTGRHSVRFNPNLYNDGKVCLSVLNTWHGRPEEKWNAQTSSFLQVLVSIQSLILVPEPYFNEPGYERSRGTSTGTSSSKEYNINICQATLKWAMIEQLKNPSPCFKTVIQSHFWIKRNEIFSQIERWISEVENDESSKSISTSLALKRLFKMLCEEMSKLTPPPGLEDLNDNALERRLSSTWHNKASAPSVPQTAPSASSANNFSQDIDKDAEMEMLVSKVVD